MHEEDFPLNTSPALAESEWLFSFPINTCVKVSAEELGEITYLHITKAQVSDILLLISHILLILNS